MLHVRKSCVPAPLFPEWEGLGLVELKGQVKESLNTTLLTTSCSLSLSLSLYYLVTLYTSSATQRVKICSVSAW